MLKNWRSWVLLTLFFGPFLAYMGLGLLWLKDRGWIWVSVAGVISIIAGVAFTLLMNRWTKSRRDFLPPIDWDAPQTFSEFDRKAWELVEAEAERGELLEMATLTSIDTYIDTGKRLASRLAVHYHPLSADPIDRIPVIEMLTALELAAEDLTGLCRQVPGGDLVTPADWKRAVVAANYIQKASDLYSYLLPLFNPVTGISRLASQHLMVKPAWKNMQQNVLRWFHRAFVNRLGTHLVELYSGRLVIGSDGYRKLTRKPRRGGDPVDPTTAPLAIAVVGARHAGKSRLIAAIDAARKGDPSGLAARMASLGGDAEGLARLRGAELVEVDSYTANPTAESARDRSTRRHAVEAAADSDLLILAVDAVAGPRGADIAFLEAWAKWYVDHPGLSIPPALAVLTHVDSPKIGGEWEPPHDWANGKGEREAAVRARLLEVRAELPPTVSAVVPAAPGADPHSGVADALLPPLTLLCHRAERNALIRQLRISSARSKAGRLFRQVGDQGRSLWQNLRARGKRHDGDAA